MYSSKNILGFLLLSTFLAFFKSISVGETGRFCAIFVHFGRLGGVPDRRRRNPEVVLVRRWVIGVLGIWRGRVWGKGETGEVSLQAT
jgi:hypothetical protein